MTRIQVIDTHTAGEPTRVVLQGGPDLGGGPVAEQAKVLAREYDRYRSAMVNEPRGSEVLVGALLTRPSDPSCLAGVIFFNNVGLLGMCGHGAMGVMTALHYLRRITSGIHRLETPVGVVTAQLHPQGSVSITNVPSYRLAKSVTVEAGDLGRVTGDVAWGGNWFYLVEQHGQALELSNLDGLVDYAWRVRQAINGQGYPQVDHIELFGKGRKRGAHARNFVLCPGKAYDRSPCGTGTSAKLACLAADGQWAEGERWIQESIIGGVFEGCYERAGEAIVPTITGQAYVHGENTLLLNEADPFCWGIRSQ